MVAVAVQLDSMAYERILRAVKLGKYASPHDFLVAAAWNQLALDDMTEPAATPEPKRAPRDAKEANGVESDQSLLAAVHLDPAGLPPVPPIEDPDRVLWGQVNRLLPVAVGLRVLAQLSIDRPGGVPVDLWHDQATRVAIAIRPRLRQLDEDAERMPGMRWAIGMPESTPESRHRYTNQFLGMPRSSSISDGACLFLGFAVASESPNGMLAIPSDEGARFAAIRNPLFDQPADVPASTFSDSEVEFYMDYLERYRQAELRFLRRVAALVDDGLPREKIDDALAESYPAFSRVSSTMRAGALGRLSDLGLVARQRTGSNVAYLLTPLAARVGLGTTPS